MKGDERKAFMSKCLKKDYTLRADTGSDETATASAVETTAATPVKQQNKMKTCNADAKAKELKGADRKAFMSACLKG